MNPITRIDGRPYITGTQVATSRVYESHLAGCEPWVLAKEYGITVEQAEFAVLYEQKRNRIRAQRRNDPKRDNRLRGKRNAGAGRRAEKWVCDDLGSWWMLRGGAGRVDVEYLGGEGKVPAVKTLEVKRRKGADKSLRMQLVQNGVSALIRTYGQEPGVRQVEPTVVMRWSVWKQLLLEAGYVVKSGTAVREEKAS